MLLLLVSCKQVCPPGYERSGGTCVPSDDTPTDSTPPPCTDSDRDCYDTGDCAPDDPAVHPGATEVCDDIDNDCDGDVDGDAQDQEAWYIDADGDGYGAGDYLVGCDRPASGTAVDAGDCDDTDAAAHPGAAEVCNFADDDCNGAIDEVSGCHDTGVAAIWVAGEASLSGDGTSLSGAFGYDFTKFHDMTSLCRNQGEITTATKLTTCPQCDWAFDFLVADSTAEGELCELFGLVGGEWDGYQGSWGFAQTYDWTDEDGAHSVENALFYYVYTREWRLVAYDNDAPGTAADIAYTAPTVTFHVYYYQQPYYTP